MTTTDFAMFSEEGNRAVAEMVEQARGLEGEKRDSFLQRRALEISHRHAEVFDTMVREIIAAELGDPAIAYWKLFTPPKE